MMTLSRQQVFGAGLFSAALAAVALAAANFTGDGENGGAGPYAVTLAISLVIAGAVFGWAIPRTERPARPGLLVATFALLSVPVFWSGLPYVLGPAAIVYGLLGRARPQGGGAAKTAIFLGALATVLAVGVLVWDAVT
jgi:hypothetical protein